LHTGKEKAMRQSRIHGFVVSVAVLGLLVLGWVSPGRAVTVNDGCTDAGGGSQDIASLTATFDATTETIHVDLVLCAAPDDATKYRVRFDHTEPFFDDDDRNGDGVVDANDVCATCPSRKSEDMNILDFFLSCPHPGPVCFRSFYTLS
jgi:hypothetical protein